MKCYVMHITVDLGIFAYKMDLVMTNDKEEEHIALKQNCLLFLACLLLSNEPLAYLRMSLPVTYHSMVLS